MGGKKKIGLKKMERMQMRRGEQERRKKEKTVGPKEKKSPGIIPPDPKSEKIVDELKRMRVLTPYNVASRFNIRISAAKGFLKQLEEKGVVQMVSGNHSIKIYKAVD